MKVRSRFACISAAVAAFMCAAGVTTAQARDLTWDANGAADPAGQDGSGAWELTNANWFDSDPVTGGNVAWTNTPPDSAFFGNSTTAPILVALPHNIDFAAPITAQNISLGTAADGGIYNFSDYGGGVLTLAGNVTKVTTGTGSQFLLDSTTIVLDDSNHVFAMNDTSGDIAELSINTLNNNEALTGPGSLTVDNGAYVAWGTLAINGNSSYTGATNIIEGRLVITMPGALGSTATGTTISNQGALSFGGAGSTVPGGGLNISEPITITRNTYSGGDFGFYPAAVISANGSGTNTISGPLIIDSTDARIAAASSTLILPGGNISLGPNGGDGVLSFTGDYAGFVELQGSNPALATNGIKLVNAVEVRVSSHAALGGEDAPITFSGDATLGIMNGFMNTFGTHEVNYDSFSGGLNIPEGQTFTLTQPITGGAGMGKRGNGTLNFNAAVTRTAGVGNGGIFWDGGIVNINANHTVGAIHLRSPVVNIASGVTLTTNGDYSAFGQDGSDNATVNIVGSGRFHADTGADFNISDNAGTRGTVNLHNTASLEVEGKFFIGKSDKAVGTLNIHDDAVVIGTRPGAESFVVGQSTNQTGAINPAEATPPSVLNKTGGTLTVAGEAWIGNNFDNRDLETGNGLFNHSGGETTFKDWFVVGRFKAKGEFNLSGGIVRKQGGGNTEIDVFGGPANRATTSTMTVSNNAQFLAETGDFRIGVGGGGSGTLLVKDTGKIIVTLGEFWVGNGGATGVATFQNDTSIAVNNNWVAIGRAGGNGTLNLSGNATLTKAGGGNTIIGDGSVGKATLADNAKINVNAGQFWVGQAGGSNSTLDINGPTAAVTGNDWIAIGRNGGTGIVNLTNGSFTKAGGNSLTIGSGGGGNGTFNQTGGTLTANNTTYIGEGGIGVVTLAGGTATFNNIDVGRQGGASGTLSISNTAVVTANVVQVGQSGTVTSTLNLNGGSLTANSVVGGAGIGNRVVNFNGGTLKAAADNAAFMQNLTAARVKNGGATIDSNGRSITIAQPLLADGTGGLTKLGAGTVTLTGANTYTGPTVANAGTLVIGNSLTTSSSVTAANDAVIEVATGGGNMHVIKTPSVSIASAAKIDLKENKLITGNAVGTATEGVYNGLQGEVQRAYNFGSWNGAGLTTSMQLALDGVATVGVATGEQIRGLGPTDTDVWGGQTINGASTIAMYTYAGDANLDGQVDAGDYGILDAFIQVEGATGYGNGDFNYDGFIDPADYGTIDNSIQFQGPPIATSGSAGMSASLSGVTAVPEPASLSVIAFGAATLLGRRRRRTRSRA